MSHSGLFTFSGGPTDAIRTFEIPDLIENKYQFKFELEAHSTELSVHTNHLRYDVLKTTVSHSDHLDFQVKFEIEYFNADDEDLSPTLVIKDIVYAQFDDIEQALRLFKWAICYSLRVMSDFKMIAPASNLDVSKNIKQILKLFSKAIHITDSQTLTELQSQCSTPLPYDLVFDPTGKSDVTTIPLEKRFNIRQYPLASGDEPGRVIGRPSTYNPLALNTVHNKYDGLFSRRFDIADLHLNEWFDARRTVVYQASNEKGPWKLVRVISNLVPIVAKWDALELRQLLMLFREEDYNNQIPLQRFGEANLEYKTDTNSLYLAFFYNYSTKHLSADQIQRYHRERWRGVMKQMLCAAIQFFLNDSGHYVDDDSEVRLSAVPYYHGDDDNPDYLEQLQNYYTNNFGFRAVDNTSEMKTTIKEITQHCTEALSSFEDEVMPGQPIRKSTKRKFDDMMSDAITQTQPTMLHPIAPTMPDKQTLDEIFTSVYVFLAETKIDANDNFDHHNNSATQQPIKLPKAYIDEKQKRNKNVYERITTYVITRVVAQVCFDFLFWVMMPEQGTFLYLVWSAMSRSNVFALLVKNLEKKQKKSVGFVPTFDLIDNAINNEVLPLLSFEDQQTLKLELNDIFESAVNMN